MGTTLNPDDPPPDIPPGDPGYIPPPDGDAKIAFVTQATNFTFTEDMIVAAGGPWTNFTVRVTPINDFGIGTPMERDVEITDDGVIIIDGQIS